MAKFTVSKTPDSVRITCTDNYKYLNIPKNDIITQYLEDGDIITDDYDNEGFTYGTFRPSGKTYYYMPKEMPTAIICDQRFSEFLGLGTLYLKKGK